MLLSDKHQSDYHLDFFLFGEVTRKMNARDNLNADSTLFVNYFYRI